MPNSNYIRGRAAEYSVRAKLERAGWTVFRFPGSKPFDLIALRPIQWPPGYITFTSAHPTITTGPGQTITASTTAGLKLNIMYEVAVVEVKSGEFSRHEVQEEAARARELLPGTRFFLYYRIKRPGKEKGEWAMEEL
jgi:hypothetical protein